MSRRAEDIEVRPITEPEIRDWSRALSTGFLRSPALSDHDVADLATYVVRPVRSPPSTAAPTASWGPSAPSPRSSPPSAGRPSPPTRSPTSPSRPPIAAAASSRMMALDLAAAKERGDVAATLIAAEYPIYGRFGFGPPPTPPSGPSTSPARLDRHRSIPDDGGRIDLVDVGEVRKLGPELHGASGSPSRGRSTATSAGAGHHGCGRQDARPWTEPFHAVYRSRSGRSRDSSPIPATTTGATTSGPRTPRPSRA